MYTLLAGTALFTCSVRAQEKEAPAKPIREFDVETIQKLGREIHVRDTWTAKAFDILLAKYKGTEVKGIAGWVTERKDNGLNVHIIRKVGEEFLHGYRIRFTKDDPVVTDMGNATLPNAVNDRYSARQRSLAAIPKHYTKSYNAVVLDDPKRGGWLVYALASTTDPNIMLMGGHYRMSVPKDPAEKIQVDALSRSLVAIQKSPKEEKEKVVGSVISHLVSNTPVETHIFGSLHYNTPFYVVIVDGAKVWKVENGKMELTDIQIEAPKGKE